MGLKIKNERIIGTIDNLEDKLEGKLPVDKLELLYLINSWGRIDFFYTQYLDEDIKIEKCGPKECYDLSKLDVSEITNMEDLFSYSDFTNIHSTNGIGLHNGDISQWNTSKVFYEAKNFNSPLNSWDTSNLFSMYSIFTYSNFNQNINSWDVSKVTDMGYAFCNTENFNQPLNKWNTSNVINMIGMFGNSIFNQDISQWDISKVTNMNSMLYNAKFFNQNISKWNFDKVNYCDYMFKNSETFLDKYNSGESLPLDTKEIKEWLINNRERMNMIDIKENHGKEIDDFFSNFSNKEFSKEI